MLGRRSLAQIVLALSCAVCAAQETQTPMFVCGSEHPRSAGPCATPPKALYSPEPTYSEEARRAGLEGTVRLGLVVSPEGGPRDIHVVKSLEKGLDEKAVEAVSQWRFDPATLDGKPVAVKINVEVNFHLYVTRPSAKEGDDTAIPEGLPEAGGGGPSEADQFLRLGNASFRARDYAAAAAAWKRAVELEPGHLYAWNNLCMAYFELRMLDEAVAACRKQIAITPDDKYAHNNLGRALWAQNKLDEAEQELRKQIAINPSDRWASANLGMMLSQRGHCDQALEPLERAARITPENAVLGGVLGGCDLEAGQKDKALAEFERALSKSRAPVIWNNIAYSLATHATELDRALRYAETAVLLAESDLQAASLDRLRRKDLADTAQLASYWDTLGWVCFVRGEHKIARKYLQAAWSLRQDGVIGDHLAQASEQSGRKSEAAQEYAAALVYPNAPKATRGRLAALLEDDSKVGAVVEQARIQVKRRNEIELQGPAKEDGKAVFALDLANDGSVQRARWISGDPRLSTLAATLAHAATAFTSPDDAGVPILRYGDMTCESGRCKLSLLSAELAVNRLPSSPVAGGVLGGVAGSTAGNSPRTSAPGLVSIPADLTETLLLEKVDPAYPPLARQARIQGTVDLEAVISTEGEVSELKAVRGHPMLIPAAMDAVKQWRYKPYRLNGAPVEVETHIFVTFSLGSGKNDAPSPPR